MSTSKTETSHHDQVITAASLQQSSAPNKYSDNKFWKKITKYAKSAGKDVVEKALLLFYAAQEEDTPVWAKATVMGALGYFINLFDAIPDLTPVLGYSDDLTVLALALASISACINQNVRDKTEKRMLGWFGDGQAQDDANKYQ